MKSLGPVVRNMVLECNSTLQASPDERITTDIIQPGLILILREVFPNVCGWRYNTTTDRRTLMQRCAKFLTLVLQQNRDNSDCVLKLKKTCIYSLLYTENALELLKIISAGKIILVNLRRMWDYNDPEDVPISWFESCF